MITMIILLKIQRLQKNGGYRWPMMRLPMRILSDIDKCSCYSDVDVDDDVNDDDDDDGDDVDDDDNEEFTKVNPE